MKGKRCMVCDKAANHYENGFAYCGIHDHAALKRQHQSWRDELKLRKLKLVGHHTWSHDGPCEPGCYYETVEDNL